MNQEIKNKIHQVKHDLKIELINKLRVLRHKLFVFSLVLVPVIVMTFYGTYKVNQFFDQYTLQFRSPIQSPVLIVKREKPIAYEVGAQGTPIWENYTGIEQDICKRFGTQCDMAVAVSKAENGSHDCSRANYNKNGTVDIGLMQINQLHWDKYSKRELLDCQINLNAAWELYQSTGWGAWAAYNNGSYKKFLVK